MNHSFCNIINYSCVTLFLCLFNISSTLAYDYTDHQPYSQLPPQGLSPNQVPLFFSIGFDDNSISGIEGSGGTGGMTWILDYLRNKNNPVGLDNLLTYDSTPIRVSFYNSSKYHENTVVDDPFYVKRAWHTAFIDGHEIGIHTVNHLHGSEFSVSQWNSEIGDTLIHLSKPFDPNELPNNPSPTSGMGADPLKLTGFRTPFLEYNDEMFSVLVQQGYTYDTSIEEGWEFTIDGSNYPWPYTLDSGSPGNQYMLDSGFPNKVPLTPRSGLWELGVNPLIIPPDNMTSQYGVNHSIRNKAKSNMPWLDLNDGKITGFDYNLWALAKLDKAESLATLKYTLDLRLQNGNRAPFMLGAHTDYFGSKNVGLFPHISVRERQEVIEEFITYAQSKPEVRIVPFISILNWMRNPSAIDCSVNCSVTILPPMVTNPGNQSNEIDSALELTIEATDPNGFALHFTAENLPIGLSIDPISGLISGIVNTASLNSVNIKADNGEKTTIITFDWEIVTLPNGGDNIPLIAGYPFEEGTGNTVLDLSGNGNNGTLTGGATRNLGGETGEAIEFNGADSSINLGAMNITTPTMSIALWFKPDDFGISDARLISKANGTSGSAHYWMISTISQSGQSRLRFRLKTENGGTSTLIGNAALIPGVWTHVTATYDGVNMKLFQNGIEVGSLAKTGAISTSPSIEAWIGANPGNNKFFDGLIDDVRLYGDALDGSTIQELVAGNLPLIDGGGNNTDTESPSTPGNLTAQPTAAQVDLSWTAATDNVGVTLYRVSMDGTETGTTATTSFQATGLNSGQSYSFSVIAEDASGNQSTAATVSATTLTSTDTVAPSIPTGLTLDSAAANAVSISWTASTDDQGTVASYRVFRDTVEVGTSTTTTYIDNTVQAEQSYLYTVSAIDDSGNESSQSTTLLVDTPVIVGSDITPPTIPTGLTLNNATASSVSISWTASTDIQGTVALYHILRDGSEIGTSAVASYTDNTVASETTYTYTVTAEDDSTNESAASADLNVDTPTNPTTDGSQLIAGYPFEEGTGNTVLDLSGNGNNGTLTGGATRNLSGETGEAIEFNGTDSSINLGAMNITTPTMSIALWFKPDDFGISDARLISKANGTASSAHYWMISTIRQSGQSRLRFRLKTENGGTSTLIGNAALIPSVWTHVTATYDGINMKLFQNSIEVGSLAKTGAISTSPSIEAWIGANPSNNKFFDGLIDDVRLYGEALDGSTIQAIVAGSLPLIDNGGGNNTDTESPSTPGNLTAQPTAAQVDLNWTAATDNVGVVLYRVAIDGTETGTAATTSFQATGLNAGQSYSFSVIAEDASGNQSTAATVTATTLSTTDTIVPSIPTDLTLDSAAANVVSISWIASTDDQGTVASYRVFRDTVEVGTSTTTTYTDNTVQAEQSYLYSVLAIDDSGNESSQSTTLSVNTPVVVISDITPPTIPTGLTLNNATASSVSISWTASTDTQGTVSLYHILRDGSEIGTSAIASYTDNTVASETTYTYTVTAEDDSTNESAASADLNVDTPTNPTTDGSQLIAGYPFEEGTGNTVLDLSGNGNNGTLTGGATRNLSGETGEAIEFNGTDSSINLGAMNITTPTMSIALWFKPDDFGISDARLISKANGTASSAHYWMISTIRQSGQSRLRFRLKTENGGTSTLIGNAALIPSVWTHVTATYDGINMKLFQNSIEVGSLAKTGAISTSPSIEAWIGANPSNNKFFDGLIDDVRIYGEALDTATIQNIVTGSIPL